MLKFSTFVVISIGLVYDQANIAVRYEAIFYTITHSISLPLLAMIHIQ